MSGAQTNAALHKLKINLHVRFRCLIFQSDAIRTGQDNHSIFKL
jgi:hypothetical protein